MDRAGAAITLDASGVERRRAVTPNYIELARALLPEAALIVGALLVLGIDLFGGRKRTGLRRLRTSVLIGLLALTAAVYGTFEAGMGGNAFGGVMLLDPL